MAVPSPLAALPVATVRIGELELRVAIAETPATRSRGLMDVDDLGSLEGMVFVFPATTQNGFHMKNVPAPLDIAFIGADGRVIEVQTMATCPAEPCPIYRASSPFLWAVETPAGGLSGVAPGDRFELSERTDPPEAAPS